jgi:hypothetical protein
MSSRKKTTIKVSITKASRSGSQIEHELDIAGEMYNDTSGFLEKGEYALRWGDI